MPPFVLVIVRPPALENCGNAFRKFIVATQLSIKTIEDVLMNLKRRMIKTSIEFIRAQRAYFKAAAPNSRKPQTELKDAAEECLKAAEPYDAALQELRQYLLAAELSEVIAAELAHTEQLINALDKEKKVGLNLITRRRLIKDHNSGGTDES